MASRGKKQNASKETLSAPLEFAMRITQRYNIRAAQIQREEEERAGITPPKPKQKLLQLQNDGTFLYNEKVVTFKNPGTLPYKVLVAIFKHQDPGLGYAPYRKINRWIEAAEVEKLEDDKQIVKRIRNAVDNIFRSSNLKKMIPTGEDLIEIVDGKGVLLRNPDIG